MYIAHLTNSDVLGQKMAIVLNCNGRMVTSEGWLTVPGSATGMQGLTVKIVITIVCHPFSSLSGVLKKSMNET